MELHKDVPVFLFRTQIEWEEWLGKNYDKFPAIWLKFAKKNAGETSINYAEALQVALCYGWIDGLINKYDNKYYLTRFSPRKPNSVWSKTNRESIEKLIAEGKVHPSGMNVIEAAKANGRWHTAYDSSKTMQIPEDFLQELAKDKKAEEFFKTLNRANTYAIAWRLQTAKKPETREKRKKQLVEMMKKGEKLH
jgi:uncharacterized protein YdeI (YjbR/CyaY-like superfamily)